jgi:hypothetical protein
MAEPAVAEPVGLKQLLRPSPKSGDRMLKIAKLVMMAVGGIVLICVLWFTLGSPCNKGDANAVKKIGCGIGDVVSAVGQFLLWVTANMWGILGGAFGAYVFVALLRMANTWMRRLPSSKLMDDTIKKKADSDAKEAADYRAQAENAEGTLSEAQVDALNAKAKALEDKAEEASDALAKNKDFAPEE